MADNPTSLALTPTPQPQELTADKYDLIKKTVAAGTSEDEFRLFVEVCNLTGLNPFARQIYAIMRNVREQDDQGNWLTVKRMTIQTGIDGYRLLAARTGQLAGIDDPIYDTEEGDHPSRATITVYRWSHGQRMPFSATARWGEYAAVNKDGNPTAMWAKMPWLMLGKVAEALALRRAFPAEITGVYTAEEMDQANNPPAHYVDASQTATPSVTEEWTAERDAGVKRGLIALRYVTAAEQRDYLASLRRQFDEEGWTWDQPTVMDYLRAQYKQQAQAEKEAEKEARQANASADDAPTEAHSLEGLPEGAGVH